MEYSGLKDKDGRDVKLVVTNDPFAHPHPIIRVENIEPVKKIHKLEFNVPGWYYKKSDLCTMFYAVRSDDWYLFNDCGNSYDKCDLCSPTPQEIEAHLRKICDEKYVGKKARCLSYGKDIDTIKEFKRYDEVDRHYNPDQMIYNSESGRLMVVYLHGKFAEIVPDEPKELPKTLEELERLLIHFKTYVRSRNTTIDTYLEEQGYKTA